MFELKNVLAIIPAREGSKRVPQKNFRPFADTTLLDLAIQQALDAKLLDNIVVNSDAPQVKEIAAKYQSNGIDFLERPKALATDESPAIDYMLQTLTYYESIGKFFDLVVIIQASSPLRNGSDIDSTIQLILDNEKADSAVSVVKLSHMIHPHKMKTMDGDILQPWLVDEGQKTSAHELPDIYVRNCAVYVFRSVQLKNGITFGNQSLGYVMPIETSVDINNMIDFKFAEYLFVEEKSKN
jgi:CMP-N,N'-diacetyllegionaminic acid synthase